ncbi:MAG: MFS transporter [Actinoallomurus sp.]
MTQNNAEKAHVHAGDPTADQDMPRHGNAQQLATWSLIGIVILLEGSYVLNSMDRNLFPLLVPDIKGEYGFALGEIGLLASIFTLGVGLGGIPAAYLLDRYSIKTIVLGSIFVFSATTALQTVAVGFFDMAAYRVISGVGEGIEVAALFATLATLFQRRRTLALGTLNFCFGVGGFLGPLLGGYLLGLSGIWRLPMWVFAGAAIVFIVALWILMPSRLGRGTAAEPRRAAGGGSATSRSASLLSRNVVILLGVAAVSGFYLFSFVSLFPTYLRGEVGLSPDQAGLAAGMFGVGAMMGIPAGWLGDRFNQKVVVICGLIGCLVVGLAAFTVGIGLFGAIVIAFLAGTFSSGFMFTNTQALLQRVMPASRTGLASGLFVSFFFIPASVSGLVFGELKTLLGWSPASWLMLAVLPAVGLVGALFVDYREVRFGRVAVQEGNAHG